MRPSAQTEVGKEISQKEWARFTPIPRALMHQTARIKSVTPHAGRF